MTMSLHIAAEEGGEFAEGLVVDVVITQDVIVVLPNIYVCNARHISTRSVVGCSPLLESHTYVCSPRYRRLPPSYKPNYLGQS